MQRRRVISATVLLLAAGVMAMLVPIAALGAVERDPSWEIALYALPSLMLIGIALFGPQRLKIGLALLLPGI
ncbi:MAG: hypothetical protein KDI71_09375 [Xanthomonadales bacterium]|nr:hypothetical protein [Xanthomonadales bacterium]